MIGQSSSGGLHSLRLTSCGVFVSGLLSRLDQAIIAQNNAKAAKKRSETSDEVHRLAISLVDAVRDMKRRLAEEEQEQQLLHVDEVFNPPSRFTPRLEVRLGYRWRNSADEAWTSGNITFLHEVDTHPDYSLPVPKRKPSQAKQKDDLQAKLYQIWDHLRSIALHSVREYLKSGRDKSVIPQTFKVTTDSYTGGLNNYSTQFWREKP